MNYAATLTEFMHLLSKLVDKVQVVSLFSFFLVLFFIFPPECKERDGCARHLLKPVNY